MSRHYTGRRRSLRLRLPVVQNRSRVTIESKGSRGDILPRTLSVQMACS